MKKILSETGSMTLLDFHLYYCPHIIFVHLLLVHAFLYIMFTNWIKSQMSLNRTVGDISDQLDSKVVDLLRVIFWTWPRHIFKQILMYLWTRTSHYELSIVRTLLMATQTWWTPTPTMPWAGDHHKHHHVTLEISTMNITATTIMVTNHYDHQ